MIYHLVKILSPVRDKPYNGLVRSGAESETNERGDSKPTGDNEWRDTFHLIRVGVSNSYLVDYNQRGTFDL